MDHRPWYQTTAFEAEHLRRLGEQHESTDCWYVDAMSDYSQKHPLIDVALQILSEPWVPNNTTLFRGVANGKFGDVADGEFTCRK